MIDDRDEGDALLEKAAGGDPASWQELVETHRDRLRRMIAFRLDARLQGRVDASDVVQEAYLEAWQRLPDYRRDPAMPFFLWLRFLTAQRLVTVHRRHLGTHGRDAGREVRLGHGAGPEGSSIALAEQLLGHDPRPSEVAVREEARGRLREALERMDPIDREVLALRHFEQLSRAEAARVLGIEESAAGKRYIRALARLKGLLDPPDGEGPA